VRERGWGYGLHVDRMEQILARKMDISWRVKAFRGDERLRQGKTAEE